MRILRGSSESGVRTHGFRSLPIKEWEPLKLNVDQGGSASTFRAPLQEADSVMVDNQGRDEAGLGFKISSELEVEMGISPLVSSIDKGVATEGGSTRVKAPHAQACVSPELPSFQEDGPKTTGLRSRGVRTNDESSVRASSESCLGSQCLNKPFLGPLLGDGPEPDEQPLTAAMYGSAQLGCHGSLGEVWQY